MRSKISKKPNPVQQSLSTVGDGLSDNFEELDSDDSLEKDETELELEKLVFGDGAGFYDGLKSYQEGAIRTKSKANAEYHQDVSQISDEDQGLKGVDDADVRSMATLTITH